MYQATLKILSVLDKIFQKAGWQTLREAAKGLRRKVWTQTKILSPNIHYLVPMNYINKIAITCKKDEFVAKIAKTHLTKIMRPFLRSPKGCQLLPTCHKGIITSSFLASRKHLEPLAGQKR